MEALASGEQAGRLFVVRSDSHVLSVRAIHRTSSSGCIPATTNQHTAVSLKNGTLALTVSCKANTCKRGVYISRQELQGSGLTKQLVAYLDAVHASPTISRLTLVACR